MPSKGIVKFRNEWPPCSPKTLGKRTTLYAQISLATTCKQQWIFHRWNWLLWRKKTPEKVPSLQEVAWTSRGWQQPGEKAPLPPAMPRTQRQQSSIPIVMVNTAMEQPAFSIYSHTQVAMAADTTDCPSSLIEGNVLLLGCSVCPHMTHGGWPAPTPV